MDPLSTLSQIRQKRVEDAQMGVFAAHRQLLEQETAHEKASQEVRDYEIELPKLVEALYKDILNHKIDVILLQEKVGHEMRLTRHLDVLKDTQKKAETAVTEAQTKLVAARGHLSHQERKKDATDELVKRAKASKARQAERALGKTIDELASVNYVNARR